MWPYPKIIAHRGAGIHAPENTLAALNLAKQIGVKGIEFDVMLTKDKIPILMHDHQLGRTVPGIGNIRDYSYFLLSRLDAGSWKDKIYAQEKIPTLAQAMQYCIANNIWMNIEIKPAKYFEAQTIQHIIDVTNVYFLKDFTIELKNKEALQLPLFSSFSVKLLEILKHIAPQYPRALIVDDVPTMWQQQASKIQAQAIHINHQNLTQTLVHQIKQAGFYILCYTVNDRNRAKMLINWGVDAICTDRLDVIKLEDFENNER